MNRSIVLSTAALACLAAVLGFVAGRNWQPLDESTAISRVISRYVTETGGAEADCVAIPGAGSVWIEVQCGVYVYWVSENGRISRPQGPET